MEEIGREIEDVEEGEISDTNSVEEISEEDFNKPDAAKANNKNNNSNSNSNNSDSDKVKSGGGGGGDARVLAVRDYYSKYPDMYRGYASGLINIAWAQAVQNKPLNDIFVMKLDSESNADADANANGNNNGDDLNGVLREVVVVDDDDKEEGELEEGEIDGEDDTDCVVVGGNDSDVLGVKDVLEGITVANVAESFAETCSRLHSVSQSKVFSGPADSEKDYLVHLLFNAIEVVYSVFCSMDDFQKEEKKDTILRLFSFLKNEQTHLFSSEHMNEILVMITAIDSLGHSGVIGKEEKMEAFDIDTQQVHGNSTDASKAFKYGQSNIKGRGVMLPLFDLHKDHDLDSLPSPTREAPLGFPGNKLFMVGDEMDIAGFPPAVKTEAKKMELDGGGKFHQYETDALNAVSTYQQKFGQRSFFTDDKFPSPTPSGDCGEGFVDTNDEVSSALNAVSTYLTSSMQHPLDQMPVSSASVDKPSMHGLINSKIDEAGFGSYPVKTSVKSRDPRLRFINSDATALDLNQSLGTNNMPKVENGGRASSRKQKTVEEASLGATAPKRLRKSLENSEHITSDDRTMASNGGWFEEKTVSGSQIERNHLMQKGESELKKTLSMSSGNLTVTSNGNEQAPVTSTSAGALSMSSGNLTVTSNGNEQALVTSTSAEVSLPALLKNIAVNPTMLLNILLEQQRLSAEANNKPVDSATSTPHLTSSNSARGTDATMNTGPTMNSCLPQSSVGMLPASIQTTSMAQTLQEESGNIRMKPRDPRRILQGSSTIQKSGRLGSEQIKAIISPKSNNQRIGDSVNAQKLDVRVETNLPPTQSIAQPDITQQFTMNLKNIADIMSVPQESSTNPRVAQNVSSASVPFTSDRAEQKSAVPNSQNLQDGVGSASEACASDYSRSQTWADFEYLFEGYDDKQKAAIQKERARRLEEQNKMFAAKKLCLVLDLDHTLLNSAKFVEVDPVHDEMLRKKEEQDRGMPRRHLFRFPHMGMWTKLRPGVWNFLEKASKLFEMHLYTMGNKLYATEMAKVLDPKGVLFSGRVISRGDDAEVDTKSKDLEGVLGMESSVVIIDDSVRVWPHHKLNLIVVERYTYFPCSRRQFGLPGPSLLAIDHDERPEDGTLASSLGVIERIHQNFFASQPLEEGDVRNILASEQRKILGGCRIVFSRVIPVGEANPHLHPLWQTAEQFGASCTNQIDDQVTHVVANSLGTDKVNWAISKGKFVVRPGWVEASALLYRRANEQDFAIKPEK